MIRLLLLPVTAILVVLAVMLQNVWLYIAAGLVALSGLTVLGLSVWEQYKPRRSSNDSSPESPSRSRGSGEPSLSDLGITEIRPKSSKQSSEQSSESASQPQPSEKQKTRTRKSTTRPSEARPRKKRAKPASEASEEQTDQAVDDSSLGRSTEDADSVQTDRHVPTGRDGLFSFIAEKPLNYPVDHLLEDYLRSLHASIRAHTVCVLGLNVYADSCSVEAAVSKSAHVQRDDRISLDNHFLKNVSLDEPVTILIAEGETPTIDELGYYDGPVEVDQVAVAPLEVSGDMVGYLLADRTPEESPIQTVYYTLLADYAHLLGTILYAKMEDRPRREIISEEIEKSREQSHSLALALIHPNDADAVLQKGPEAVAQTEYLLRQTLEQTTPQGRVERFGELIYGVFYYDSDGSIDGWAEKVQTAFIENDEMVNIGIALYNDRHETPEDLRSDAAEALRVAYEAGQNECIIFE